MRSSLLSVVAVPSVFGSNSPMEATLEHTLDLLLAAGYHRAASPSLAPLDKLTGGLSWCIADIDPDSDLEPFYDDHASLAYKIKVGEVIEGSLQKMHCPHPLQARQIQNLDYEAIYPAVQWLVKRTMLPCSVPREYQEPRSSLWHFDENNNLPKEKPSYQKQEMSAASTLFGTLSAEKYFTSAASESEVVHGAATPNPNIGDAQSTKMKAETLLRQIILENENNEQLQVQRRDATEKMSKLNDCIDQQGKEKRELILKMEKLNATVEIAGMKSFLQKLLPLVEQKKANDDEESRLQLICKERHIENIQKPLAESEDLSQEICKSDVESPLQKELLRLKLLKEDASKVCQSVLSCHKKIEDVPCQAELIQYERCFVEMHLTMQEKLMEMRRYYSKFNALVEANELTLKEISLLNSINAQIEQAIISNEGRRKFVDSMSDIAKGTHQKLVKLEARLVEEQNNLAALKEKHQILIAERRQYINMVKSFQDECAKNEMLRSASLANRAV